MTLARSALPARVEIVQKVRAKRSKSAETDGIAD
jgi:hypothetical protein